MRKHPYLSHEICLERLRQWHRKNGRLIVAYDFDNTVYDYHKQGHDYAEVVELLRKSKQVGCFLIVFTGNQDTEFVKTFLGENNIPYDTINEHAPFMDENGKRARKIYYNILLDDAAGLESAYNQLEEFVEEIINQKTGEVR